MFQRKKQSAYVGGESIAIRPGDEITLDKWDSLTPASHCLLLDTSSMRASDLLSFMLEIRPAPRAGLRVYENLTVPVSPGAGLFSLDIPPCAGFIIRFRLEAGRPLVLPVYLWRT